MSTEAQRRAWRDASQARRDHKKAQTRNAFGKRRKSPQVEAIVYLRHARTAIKQQVISGANSLDDPVYLFAMLALRALENVDSTKE